MASSFNIRVQENKIESKIVVALERIAEAFRVLLWNESKEKNLSPVQIQILIFILFHEKEKCKVSYLAREFNMTKATISDSVKILLQKELLLKSSDSYDTRSFSISLTPAGKKIAQSASSFASAIEKPISKYSTEQKEMMLTSLLNLIYDLNQANIITLQRMCFTCANYSLQNGEHYCKLLQIKLANRELRIDCDEYETI
jgi:DNA-binding MarR family transcriptional regulator